MNLRAVFNEKSATFEHIVPKSKGGTDAKANIMAVCNECNQDRGNEDLALFLLRMRGRLER